MKSKQLKVKSNPRGIFGMEDFIRPKTNKNTSKNSKKNSALDKLKAIENRGK